MFKSLLRLCACYALLLAARPAISQAPDVWMKLYNGTDLAGWKGKAANWKVDTGGVVTAYGSTNANTFLVSDSSFRDFHFKCDGRLGPTSNNSGLIYRGKITNQAGYVMSGYQYEISGGGTGAFYHEQGSEIPFTRISGCYGGGVSDFVKMEIIADGPMVTHLVAGKKCFEKPDMQMIAKGQFGLQLHSPGDFTAHFRNIFVRPLNNSFNIPADNAWDGNGNKIGIVGIDIRPKNEAANRSAGLLSPGLGYDFLGRKVPASPARAMPRLALITR